MDEEEEFYAQNVSRCVPALGVEGFVRRERDTEISRCFVTSDAAAYVWGQGTPVYRPLPCATPISQLACGAQHIAMLTTAGHVYTYGGNEVGQCGLGQDAADFVEEPTLVSSLLNTSAVTSIACGPVQTAAVISSVEFYTWGYDSSTFNTSPSPSLFQHWSFVGENKSLLQVHFGPQHTSLLVETIRGGKEVWSWGQSSLGLLGIGKGECQQRVPTKVEFEKDDSDSEDEEETSGARVMWGKKIGILGEVVQLAGSETHMLALTDEGEVFAWGNNEGNHLSLSSPASTSLVVSSPSLVSCVDKYSIRQVSCGMNFSTALTEEGEVLVWGKNDKSQLGDKEDLTSEVFPPEPITIPDLEASEDAQPVAVLCGDNHAAVVSTQRIAFVWGCGENYCLNPVSDLNCSIPTPLAAQITTISLGSNFTAAIFGNVECVVDIPPYVQKKRAKLPDLRLSLGAKGSPLRKSQIRLSGNVSPNPSRPHSLNARSPPLSPKSPKSPKSTCFSTDPNTDLGRKRPETAREVPKSPVELSGPATTSTPLLNISSPKKFEKTQDLISVQSDPQKRSEKRSRAATSSVKSESASPENLTPESATKDDSQLDLRKKKRRSTSTKRISMILKKSPRTSKKESPRSPRSPRSPPSITSPTPGSPTPSINHPASIHRPNRSPTSQRSSPHLSRHISPSQSSSPRSDTESRPASVFHPNRSPNSQRSSPNLSRQISPDPSRGAKKSEVAELPRGLPAAKKAKGKEKEKEKEQEQKKEKEKEKEKEDKKQKVDGGIVVSPSPRSDNPRKNSLAPPQKIGGLAGPRARVALGRTITRNSTANLIAAPISVMKDNAELSLKITIVSAHGLSKSVSCPHVIISSDPADYRTSEFKTYPFRIDKKNPVPTWRVSFDVPITTSMHMYHLFLEERKGKETKLHARGMIDVFSYQAMEDNVPFKVDVYDHDTKISLLLETDGWTPKGILPHEIDNQKLNLSLKKIESIHGYLYFSLARVMKQGENEFKLIVKTSRCENVDAKDLNGLSDPFITINYGKKKHKTKVCKKTLNPVFDEEFLLDVNLKKETILNFTVLDWNLIGAKDFIGMVVVNLSQFTSFGEEICLPLRARSYYS